MSHDLKVAWVRHMPELQRLEEILRMAESPLPTMGFDPDYGLLFYGLDLDNFVGGEYGN